MMKLTRNCTDGCQIASYGHPTLCLGIFMIYCEHGVCYGFEVLQTCELPKHPFQIFKTRFPWQCPLIIMPVAHMCTTWTESLTFLRTLDLLYTVFTGAVTWAALKATPWMPTFRRELPVRGSTCKYNKQANSGLQKIRDQLPYMGVENFKIYCSLLSSQEHGQKFGLSLQALHLLFLFGCFFVIISPLMQ